MPIGGCPFFHGFCFVGFSGWRKFEALSLRAEREKEPNLDAVLPREDRDIEGLGAVVDVVEGMVEALQGKLI